MTTGAFVRFRPSRNVAYRDALNLLWRTLRHCPSTSRRKTVQIRAGLRNRSYTGSYQVDGSYSFITFIVCALPKAIIPILSDHTYHFITKGESAKKVILIGNKVHFSEPLYRLIVPASSVQNNDQRNICISTITGRQMNNISSLEILMFKAICDILLSIR